jgi:TonB family protein
VVDAIRMRERRAKRRSTLEAALLDSRLAVSGGPMTSLAMRLAVVARSFLPALLLGVPSKAIGQTIGGLVIDRTSRLPLRRITVQALGDSGRTMATTETDTAGVFYVSLSTGGAYRLRFALDSVTSFDSDTIRVPGDGYVERQFVVALPRAYFEFEVEKQVQAVSGSAHLRYPAALKRANIEGGVLAQFVVDTTGRVELRTFKVLRATHEDFVEAVRDVLPRLRFLPAEIGGRKVKQMVQQPFDFRLTY